MNTPVSSALTRLKTRLSGLRNDEGGFTLIETIVVFMILPCVILATFINAGYASQAAANSNPMPDINKPTAMMAQQIKTAAKQIYFEKSTGLTPLEAKFGMSYFEAEIRKRVNIPTNAKFSVCKTRDDEIPVVAYYDPDQPKDGFTYAHPYVDNGLVSGKKIDGNNYASCAKWAEVRQYELDALGNYIYDKDGARKILEVGDFIWTSSTGKEWS